MILHRFFFDSDRVGCSTRIDSDLKYQYRTGQYWQEMTIQVVDEVKGGK